MKPMKKVAFVLLALAILGGCDAGNNKKPSASPTDIQRKTDDAKQF